MWPDVLICLLDCPVTSISSSVRSARSSSACLGCFWRFFAGSFVLTLKVLFRSECLKDVEPQHPKPGHPSRFIAAEALQSAIRAEHWQKHGLKHLDMGVPLRVSMSEAVSKLPRP